MGNRGLKSQESDALLGEFEQRLDDKNRTTFPARLRDQFEDGLVLLTAGSTAASRRGPRAGGTTT